VLLNGNRQKSLAAGGGSCARRVSQSVSIRVVTKGTRPRGSCTPREHCPHCCQPDSSWSKEWKVARRDACVDRQRSPAGAQDRESSAPRGEPSLVMKGSSVRVRASACKSPATRPLVLTGQNTSEVLQTGLTCRSWRSSLIFGWSRDAWVGFTRGLRPRRPPRMRSILTARQRQFGRPAEFRAQPVILPFYPETGARFARINWPSTGAVAEFQRFDAELVGISVDGVWSHLAFAKDRNLHFPLLADFRAKGRGLARVSRLSIA
jgi:hypothetical protein